MLQKIIYTRFSSDMQDENSTDTQMRKIKEFAAEQGFELHNAPSIYNDEGTSGRSADRKEFLRMYSDIKSGRVKTDGIIVYKYSRFMRDFEEAIIWRRRFKSFGVDIISATEKSYGDDPSSKLTANIMASIDQHYSDMLAGLSLEGLKQIVLNGYWPGGPAPFGYGLKRVENLEGHKRKGQLVMRNILTIEEAEARIVSRIFAISAETGKGGNLIYKQLCDEMGCVVVGRSRRKQGPNGETIIMPAQPIGGRGVNDIMRKKIYKGVFIYNSHGYETNIDEATDRSKKKRISKPEKEWVEIKKEEWRIVSDEIWNTAQTSRISNQSIRKDFGFSQRKASYALTGLVECGTCGRNFGGKWQRSFNLHFSEKSEYYYYRCRYCKFCANKIKVDGQKLEAAIISAILDQLLNKDFLAQLANEIIESSRAPGISQHDRAELEQRRKDISAGIERLVDLVKNLPTNVGEVAAQIRLLENERADIDSKLKFQTLSNTAPSAEELLPLIEKKLEKPRQLFATESDVHALRWELGRWVETVRVDQDGKI